MKDRTSLTKQGINLIKIRKELGLTQRDLCLVLDIHTSQYNRYEKGFKMIGFNNLNKLVEELKVNPVKFFI